MLRLIATADHEHAIALNGYCGRGTPISGLCLGIDNAGIKHNEELQLGDDGQPYPVEDYLNGGRSILKKEKIPTEFSMETNVVAEDAPATSENHVADADTSENSGSDAIQAHGDRLAADLMAQLDVTTATNPDTVPGACNAGVLTH